MAETEMIKSGRIGINYMVLQRIKGNDYIQYKRRHCSVTHLLHHSAFYK